MSVTGDRVYTIHDAVDYMCHVLRVDMCCPHSLTRALASTEAPLVSEQTS